MNTQVVIAGNGIAGLVLSLLLERKGISHIVLARRGKSKELALAETLPPSALPLLQNLGILEVFETTAVQKTYGYHSVWGSARILSNNFFFHRPFQYGLKINKQAILDTFEELQQSHVVYCSRIQAATASEQAATITYQQERELKTVRALLIVDATGRSRALLGKLGISHRDYDTLMAFSCHLPYVKHPSLAHSVFIESFEKGWSIISALNETKNVCTLFTQKDDPAIHLFRKYEHWPRLLSGTTYLQEFLPAKHEGTVRGSKANSSIAHPIAGNRILAVGDAAISFDPLSSHGITNAIYTAQQAADTIERYVIKNDDTALAEYDASLNAIFTQYLHMQKQLYGSERRWPNAAFWKSNQQQVFDRK